jgi:exopolysaccharide biosynthesis protein
MTKIVKLKQSDVEKIVQNIVRESQEFDDFDTKVQSEELSNMEDESAVELALGQDDEGNFYVMDVDDQDNPKILFKTK